MHSITLRECLRGFVAFGASSGGSFVASLTLSAQLGTLLRSVSIIISPAPSLPLQRMQSDTLFSHKPPFTFIHMPHDQATAYTVEVSIQVLARNGFRCAEGCAYPMLVDDAFFSRRIDGFSLNASARVVAALRKHGLVSNSGALLADPRQKSWRYVLRNQLGTAILGKDSLALDRSQMSEELNVAYGKHELLHDHTYVALNFIFDNH